MKTPLLTKFLIAGLFIFASVLMSCEKNSPDVTPQNTDPIITALGTETGDASSAVINESGGILNSADGKLTVTIPAGALASATEISIQPVTNNAPLGLGLAYRLQPEGLTFASPVQLTFRYDQTILKDSPEDFLWIVTQAANGSWNAMLKSVPDKSAKTVTVNTTHFSDWALGSFLDFILTPSSRTIQKGQSVELRLSGFVRDQALQDDDELAPLIPITGDGDELTPLTPIPPVESRLMNFKVKSWTLNGSVAPVSNSNGSLSASGNNATYKAPDQIPTPNPVAVSVQLEADNKEGGKSTFIITSSISVVESDLYLIVKVDGQVYEYYEYGFNGAIPPDPNNFSIVNCGLADGKLEIIASLISNSSVATNIFNLTFSNPSETTKSLIGFNEDGYDDMNFAHQPGEAYSIDYTSRILKANEFCDQKNICGNASVTLLTYSVTDYMVRGYFSGTLYEDKPGYSDLCKMPDPHAIEGEFRLMLAH